MKIKIGSLLIILFLFSCSNKPKHPQADLASRYSDVPENERSILLYADSIDIESKNMNKHSSLVYQMDGKSLYAEKYSWQGVATLYIEQTTSEGLSEKTSRLYLKNDTLLLIKELMKRTQGQDTVFEEKRTFLRSNIPFKQEHKTAISSSALNTRSFQDLKIASTIENYTDQINTLNAALSGTDKFELIFDQFISSSEGQYILLKSSLPGGYHSSITVNENDAFTDSLLLYPQAFKDARLPIKWEVQNKEAFYVPVAASVTSAKGLKR
ncbi:MAG TPA: hypothetical protein VKB19_19365 [Pedobacter sp.]|nr:hypothetical protein [Pedobacter sp.]